MFDGEPGDNEYVNVTPGGTMSLASTTAVNRPVEGSPSDPHSNVRVPCNLYGVSSALPRPLQQRGTTTATTMTASSIKIPAVLRDPVFSDMTTSVRSG